jgi:hypothetical protein
LLFCWIANKEEKERKEKRKKRKGKKKKGKRTHFSAGKTPENFDLSRKENLLLSGWPMLRIRRMECLECQKKSHIFISLVSSPNLPTLAALLPHRSTLSHFHRGYLGLFWYLLFVGKGALTLIGGLGLSRSQRNCFLHPAKKMFFSFFPFSPFLFSSLSCLFSWNLLTLSMPPQVRRLLWLQGQEFQQRLVCISPIS